MMDKKMCAAVKPLAWITLEVSDWLKVYDGPACAKITAIHRVPPKSGMGVPVYSEPLTIRPEAEVRAEAWVAAIEAALDAADKYMRDQYGIGALSHPIDRVRILDSLSHPADARAALDRIKAEAKDEGMRIGVAREKMRALTEWLNEDEDNGELLMASLDGDTIDTLRAILAAIPEVRK